MTSPFIMVRFFFRGLCVLSGLVTLLAVCPVHPALAEKPPEKKEKLTELNQKLEREKAKQQELSKKVETLEKDVKGIRQDLITTTGKVQVHEKNLQSLEDKLADLQGKKKALTDKLTADRGKLAGLILAMERIRRLPPETLIARPGAPLETAQAATVLAAILPELNKRAEDLKVKLADLDAIETELRQNQDALAKTTEKLRSDKERMDSLLEARTRAYSKTRDEAKAQEMTVAQISKEAQNLRDLIEKLEKKNREARLPRMKLPKGHKDDTTRTPDDEADEAALNASLPSLGTAQLPVSGIIKTRYGERDNIGALSEGVRIEARPGAVVVAPMGGIVRYAGPFKTYGSIILLEHKNKYHSLVAGLGKIDTFVGQSVDAGEPLGRLPDSSGSGKTSLYYELRYKGQPINPSRKFSDLGG